MKAYFLLTLKAAEREKPTWRVISELSQRLLRHRYSDFNDVSKLEGSGDHPPGSRLKAEIFAICTKDEGTLEK